MPKPRLTAVTRTQGNNRALKDGTVRLPDFDLVFEEVDPLTRAFRRMVREGAYDISEMALTTYLCAKAHGARLTGLPIFLVREFHHKAIVRNPGAGIETPPDLEGRRVGVNRGYTVTTGVWAREILRAEHGVDLNAVTWACSGDEHVAAYVPPANVERLGGEGTLEEQLSRGDIGAAVGLSFGGEGIAPLIPEAFAAGLNALKSRGFYPINHLIVIRDEVLAAHPGLATQIFEAFAASKRRYLDALRAGRIGPLTDIDRVHLAAMEVLPDPLPYGLAPNATVLETLMAAAVSQGILAAPLPPEALFARDVLEAVG